MVADICEKLSHGRSLTAILKEDGMPSYTACMEWLDKYPEFAQKYARAREHQAEYVGEETLEISDNDSIPSDQKRIMVDTRKWYASKMLPKKYGNNSSVDLTSGGQKLGAQITFVSADTITEEA
jgi:hypothetical protein